MNRPLSPPVVPSFAVASATGDHWGLAAKACLERLAGRPANVGFLYVTETFNQNLSSVLTFLRETTRIAHWAGAVVPAVIADGEVIAHEGGMAVMTGLLPENSFRTFWSLDADESGEDLGGWLHGHAPCLAVAHGDPRSPGIPALVRGLAGDEGCVVGGLVSSSGPPAQLADTVVSGGIAGMLLGGGVAAVSAVTQGCSPIGSVHRVDEAVEGVVMRLDGRPAVEVLKQEAGQLIARDLRRAAGYIHVAVPVAGSDSSDYLVRTLLGIDTRQGWLAVGERVEDGAELLFVRRDPQAAQADMARMLADVTTRLAGRPALAAFYHSCVGRGGHIFGADEAEIVLIRAALGEEVPLIGFFGHGEFAGARMYGYTGVLTVLAGERP